MAVCRLRRCWWSVAQQKDRHCDIGYRVEAESQNLNGNEIRQW